MRLAAIGLFVLCAVLLFAPSQTEGATFYNPCSIVSLGSASANTASSITQTFGVGLDAACAPFVHANDRPGEWLATDIVDFTPPSWYVPTDADIPDGTEVGQFSSQMTLGLFDNGCNQILKFDRPLLDGTIDRRKVVSPKPRLMPDRLRPIAMNDENGIPRAASGWPSYLNNLPERTGMSFDKLRARFVGVDATSIPGLAIIWNFLVFEPGATISRKFLVDPKLGYPIVAVVQDPTAPASSGDPVSDFCAPIRREYKLNDTAGGKAYRRNPGDGVYNFTTYSIPAPDADNDGIENAMDPCPYNPNVSGWDPRGVLEQGMPGDNDVDGLPLECDPNPARRGPCSSADGVTGHDEDCDGWANRSDDCPLASNEDQLDTDGDGIGDACDQDLGGKGTVDGQNIPACNVSTVTIGSGGPTPGDPTLLPPCGIFACTCDPLIPTPTPASLPRSGGPPERDYGMSSLSLFSAGLLLAGLALARAALRRLP